MLSIIRIEIPTHGGVFTAYHIQATAATHSTRPPNCRIARPGPLRRQSGILRSSGMGYIYTAYPASVLISTTSYGILANLATKYLIASCVADGERGVQYWLRA